jgi:hypothetical protein
VYTFIPSQIFGRLDMYTSILPKIFRRKIGQTLMPLTPKIPLP